jgi:lysozyme
MKTSAKMFMYIRSKETLSLDVYDDGAGVATQGYGHTGPDVVFGGPKITVEKADAWFREDLAAAEDEVRRRVLSPVTQGMFDCLVSFEFNTGGLYLKNGPSKALFALNERRYNDCVEEMVCWNIAAKKDRRGLLTRRLEESLFFTSERYPT